MESPRITVIYPPVAMLDQSNEDFDLIIPAHRAECIEVRAVDPDARTASAHARRFQTLAFGISTDRVDLAVLALPGRKPVVFARPGHSNDIFERRRKDEETRRVIALITSPRAKDRNMGRRLARKRGWL